MIQFKIRLKIILALNPKLPRQAPGITEMWTSANPGQHRVCIMRLWLIKLAVRELLQGFALTFLAKKSERYLLAFPSTIPFMHFTF